MTLSTRARDIPAVRLLPAFDTYLLGYRNRDLSVPATLQRRLQRGGGWLHPAMVVNGKAIAAWSLKTSAGRGRVSVEPAQRISSAVRAGIDAEVADVGAFLGLRISVGIGEPAAVPVLRNSGVSS